MKEEKTVSQTPEPGAKLILYSHLFVGPSEWMLNIHCKTITATASSFVVSSTSKLAVRAPHLQLKNHLQLMIRLQLCTTNCLYAVKATLEHN